MLPHDSEAKDYVMQAQMLIWLAAYSCSGALLLLLCAG
jgi:hypothetical protein